MSILGRPLVGMGAGIILGKDIFSPRDGLLTSLAPTTTLTTLAPTTVIPTTVVPTTIGPTTSPPIWWETVYGGLWATAYGIEWTETYNTEVT